MWLLQSTDGFNLLYRFNMTREHYFRVREWAWWCDDVPWCAMILLCQNLLPASLLLFLTSPGSWDRVQRRKWCFWHWLFQWFLLVYSEVLVLRCRVLVEDCCKSVALQNVKSWFMDRWNFFQRLIFREHFPQAAQPLALQSNLKKLVSPRQRCFDLPLSLWCGLSGAWHDPSCIAFLERSVAFTSIWGVV